MATLSPPSQWNWDLTHHAKTIMLPGMTKPALLPHHNIFASKAHMKTRKTDKLGLVTPYTYRHRAAQDTVVPPPLSRPSSLPSSLRAPSPKRTIHIICQRQRYFGALVCHGGQVRHQDLSLTRSSLGSRVRALTLELRRRRKYQNPGRGIERAHERDRLSLRHPVWHAGASSRRLGLSSDLLCVKSVVFRFLRLTPVSRERFRTVQCCLGQRASLIVAAFQLPMFPISLTSLLTLVDTLFLQPAVYHSLLFLYYCWRSIKVPRQLLAAIGSWRTNG